MIDPVTDPATDPLVARLRAAGCVYAEEEAALLRDAATGSDLEHLVARRVAGEPLEVLLGWAEVAGVRVRTAPGVFVPRARSGLIARLAIMTLDTARHPVVVDLGCGTGALGAVVAHHRPDVVGGGLRGQWRSQRESDPADDPGQGPDGLPAGW